MVKITFDLLLLFIYLPKHVATTEWEKKGYVLFVWPIYTENVLINKISVEDWQRLAHFQV